LSCDKVTRKADRVSDAIAEILRQRDHPVVERLWQPGTGLLFYPLDNRHGLQDLGVKARTATRCSGVAS
jgi:hypothetical protein